MVAAIMTPTPTAGRPRAHRVAQAGATATIAGSTSPVTTAARPFLPMRLARLLPCSVLPLLLSLQGCFPLIPHTEHEERGSAYALDESGADAPWIRLDNGLDFYGFHDCYGTVLRGEPCGHLQLLGLPQGERPNWNIALSTVAPIGFVEIGDHFRRPMSAHQGTDLRLLGISAASAGDAGVAAGEILLVKPSKYPQYGEVDRRPFDLWHNNLGDCGHGLVSPVPRLVVFDDRHTWVFADAPVCELAGAAPLRHYDLFAPAELLRFEGSDKVSEALLHKPMALFYSDEQTARRPTFGDPVAVSRSRASAPDVRPKDVLLDEVYRPPTPFTLDTGMRDEAIPTPPQPTRACFYGFTKFHLMIEDSNSLPSLQRCEPYSQDALKRLRARKS